MRDRAGNAMTPHNRTTKTTPGPVSLMSNVVAPVMIFGAVGFEAASRMTHERWTEPLAIVFEAALVLLGLWLIFWRTPQRAELATAPDAHRQIFDSAGPMQIVIGLDGSISHMNPAAERLLGYHASELVGKSRSAEMLEAEEGPRLVGELQRLSGAEPKLDISPAERLSTLMETVRKLPPSQVPNFEAVFRRKDGSTVPVTLHVSALRDDDG